MIVNEHEIIFDSEDAHLIEGHSWAVTKNRNIFYARNGKQYMHRIVMNAKRGIISMEMALITEKVIFA